MQIVMYWLFFQTTLRPNCKNSEKLKVYAFFSQFRNEMFQMKYTKYHWNFIMIFNLEHYRKTLATLINRSFQMNPSNQGSTAFF